MSIQKYIIGFLMLLYQISFGETGATHSFAGQYTKVAINMHSSINSKDSVKIFKYKINTENLMDFGYVETEEGRLISITSVFIRNGFVYITDEYHKNVKRINLMTGELMSSKVITNNTRFKQLVDIGFFCGHFYVSSTGNHIYLLDTNLAVIKLLYLPTMRISPVYIKNISNTNIQFVDLITDSVYTLDSNHRVVNSEKLDGAGWNIRIDVQRGIIRSKKFIYHQDNKGYYITINSKDVKLVKPFEFFSDNLIMDFDNEKLVICEVDSNELIIYIYDIPQ